MRVYIAMLLLAFYSHLAIANHDNDQVNNTAIVKSEVSHTNVTESLAKHWQLSAAEYSQYLALMEGPLGKLNPDIDPVLALGMFAKTEPLQRRYAELYAQQEHDLTERILRFQRTYHAAFNRLYPDETVISQALLAPYFSYRNQKSLLNPTHSIVKKQFVASDRVLMFVSQVCSECQTLLSRIIPMLLAIPNTGVDIYVREALDDEAVKEWARAHNINVDWFQHGYITLNQDQGLYQRLRDKTADVITHGIPIYLRRGERYFKLDNRDFL